MGMGQTECLRIQLITASALVTITSPSTLLLYPTSLDIIELLSKRLRETSKPEKHRNH